MKKTQEFVGRYEGKWWLPEREDKVIHGTLEINSNGEIYFNIFDQFEPQEFFFEVGDYSLVLGIACYDRNNKEFSFSLYDLISINRRIGNTLKYRFFVHKVLINGLKSESEPGLNFTEIMLSSEAFGNWMRDSGISVKENLVDDLRKSISVTYIEPELIELYSSPAFSVNISFSWSINSQNKTISLSEIPFLSIKTRKALPTSEILELGRILELFFMVFWEQYHIFTETDVRNEMGSIARLIGQRHQQKIHSIKGSCDKLFKTNAQRYIENWLKVKNIFDLAIRTFFFAYADYKIDIHSRFLNYVFALEQLHRLGFRDKQQLSSKDKRMYDKAMKIEQGDLKSWLEKVLNKDRDIQLTTRLIELDEFSGLSGNKKVNNEDIKSITNMRHYLVHLNEDRKKYALSSNEVYHINFKLECLFFGVLKKVVVDGKSMPQF